ALYSPTALLMALGSGKESDIIEFFNAAERTKLVALIASVILVYDILLTLPDEIRYVWSVRWSFARVAFHINRVWGSLLLGIYVPMFNDLPGNLKRFSCTSLIFRRSSFMIIAGLRLRHIIHRCILINTYYIYGTAVTAAIVADTSYSYRQGLDHLRKKVGSYELLTWVLVLLALGSLAVSIPSLVLLQMRARSSKFKPNPAPEIITGCTVKASLYGVGAYIGPLIYETGLFFLTLYKSWRTCRTPLMQRLTRDGSRYYAIVFGTLVIIGLGSMNRQTKRAFLSSGLLTAIVSAMCSRLILSGLSYHDDITENMSDLEAGTSTSIMFASNIAGSEWFEHLE
ncbi:unnamed protein product, partial [Rhizoctonia solani]